jgi:uncharacterized protein YdaU (DUF1376 family)
MSNGDRWLPLYVADYLGDTMHLTGPEHGAYLLLLMHYWRNGPLPDDDRKLAHIARTEAGLWKEIGVTIREFFTVGDDGLLHQKRMDWELRRWADISSKRSNAGKLGGAGKHRSHPTDDRPATERVRRPYDSQTKEQNSLLRARRLAEARARGTHTEEEWLALLQTCQYRCLKCGADKPGKDHIVSLYLGGSDAIGNLQPLCLSCNASKGPDTTDLRPPKWWITQPNFKQAESKPEPIAEPIAKQLPEVCSDFAAPPVQVQKKDTSLSSKSSTPREGKPPETGQDLPPPTDHLELILRESLEIAEAAHKAGLMSQERGRSLEAQKQAAAKPQRAKACPLIGPLLYAARKQAGIMAATP